jgi:lipopolysaccharide/colanic/teichoic acid biosynthesis glycosyltransferase
MYAKGVKRILDCVCAAILLAILSPVFAVLAILVASRLGTPAIFRQERPGFHAQIFTLYKFRSMTDARYTADDEAQGIGKAGELKGDDVRLTAFGRKLRATSLDELPELLNILKGDMSFVGPRPLLVEYLPRYSEEQARRHDVRPGLTGLAQVNGRNALTWEEKFAYDVAYTREVSFAADCRILAATFRAVASRAGISAEGDATMPPFLGSGAGGAETREGGNGVE